MQGNSGQVHSDPTEQTLINPASSFLHNAKAYTTRAANVQHLLLHPVSPNEHRTTICPWQFKWGASFPRQ